MLRRDGTVWLNLGDSYTPQSTHRAAPGTRGGMNQRARDLRDLVPQAAYGKPKDLVGIPWRVAFALQQPWERHVIAAPEWRGWMAGLVDGEGCYSIQAIPPHSDNGNESHSVRLQIRMADTEAVERVVAITGMNSVTYDQLAPSMVRDGQRAAQQWKVSGDKMADLTADIFPFLTVKRRQAVVAWNLQRLRDGVTTKRGVPVPAENMAKRRLLYDLVRRLNQREEGVDLPSWLTEPRVEREEGWYLRSDVIWAKPNPMPESVTDRPTKSHEYLFLLSKSARYFYDAEAVREPLGEGTLARPARMNGQRPPLKDRYGSPSGLSNPLDPAGRNLRSVWTVATQPYPGAHFATFPRKLVEPCIKAGTSERGVCPECGAPWERNITLRGITTGRHAENAALAKARGMTNASRGWKGGDVPVADHETTGWAPTCWCSAPTVAAGGVLMEPVPAVILDPFAGSGTTGMVAQSLSRKAVLIDLNADYLLQAMKRNRDIPLGLGAA